MISVKGDALTSSIGFINLIGISSLPVDVSFLREITLATRMMRQRIAEVLQSEDAVLINEVSFHIFDSSSHVSICQNSKDPPLFWRLWRQKIVYLPFPSLCFLLLRCQFLLFRHLDLSPLCISVDAYALPLLSSDIICNVCKFVSQALFFPSCP